MAYIIGNTTVIDNNAALGSVSGNSLNLANNNNIASGGASTALFTSTTNQTVVGSNLAYVFGIGGGGGASGPPPQGTRSGASGRAGAVIADVSAGGNATYNVGAGGNNRTSQGTSPAGGASGIAHTQTFNFSGGNGGRFYQSLSQPQSTFGTTPTNAGFAGSGVSNNSANANIVFPGYGGGAPSPNGSAQSGFVFTIG